MLTVTLVSEDEIVLKHRGYLVEYFNKLMLTKHHQRFYYSESQRKWRGKIGPWVSYSEFTQGEEMCIYRAKIKADEEI